jgi:PAS domain S-box-containing protein
MEAHRAELEIQNQSLREAQHALEQSRARYFTLFDLAPVGYAVCSREGRLLEINLAFAALAGEEREVLLGTNLENLIHPEDRAELRLHLAEVFSEADRRSVELRLVSCAGELRVTELESVRLPSAPEAPPLCLLAFIDLTQQRGAEEARLQLEGERDELIARLRLILESMPTMCVVNDTEGRVTYWNPAAERTLGWSREDVLGRRPQETFLSPDEPDCASLQTTARKRLSPTENTVLRENITKDCRRVICEWQTTDLRSAQGEFLGHLCMAHDVSKRIEMENAIQQSEERLRLVWEAAMDAMSLTDSQGRVVGVNGAFCRLVGLKREEVQGKYLTAAYAESAEAHELLSRHILQFEERSFPPSEETRRTLRSGRSVELEVRNAFVDLPGQSPLLLTILRDVSDQKRLLEELMQVQKMEAIGQLAGGVAHDFNNILTVVKGQAGLLLMDPNIPQERYIALKAINDAADRAATLTRQLLLFGRRQTFVASSVNLSDTIRALEPAIRRTVGERVRLQLVLDSCLPMVKGDRSILEQMLLTLAVNGRDAMNAGGTLTLSTHVVGIRRPQASGSTRVGSHVCLEVSDNGCGMDRSTLSRVFEPFFTTKGVGKGTGLGLATVYGIVKQHQGRIDVESEVGRGTTFRVYLPASTEAPEPVVEPTAPKPLARGTECILVVEDEQPVRQLLGIHFRRLGYTILDAEHGDAALGIWAAQRDQIHLVVSDVVMPGNTSGVELARRISQEDPRLPIILTSGYSVELAPSSEGLRTGVRFLPKPYDISALAELVRECLDARTSSEPTTAS